MTPQIPCASCGRPPVGTYDDGSPRYDHGHDRDTGVTWWRDEPADPAEGRPWLAMLMERSDHIGSRGQPLVRWTFAAWVRRGLRFHPYEVTGVTPASGPRFARWRGAPSGPGWCHVRLKAQREQLVVTEVLPVMQLSKAGLQAYVDEADAMFEGRMGGAREAPDDLALHTRGGPESSSASLTNRPSPHDEADEDQRRPMTDNYPTRQAASRGEYRPTWDDRRLGYREGVRLCEAWVDPFDLLCDNTVDVVWVDQKSGRTVYSCAGHVPSLDDETLKPRLECQVGRWDSYEYQENHPLTGCTPVPMADCPADAAERAKAVAARLHEFQAIDLNPAGYGPGWMGDDEDRERLEAAGERTSFPHIPESLQSVFGGARTIGEVMEGTDTESGHHDNGNAE